MVPWEPVGLLLLSAVVTDLLFVLRGLLGATFEAESVVQVVLPKRCPSTIFEHLEKVFCTVLVFALLHCFEHLMDEAVDAMRAVHLSDSEQELHVIVQVPIDVTDFLAPIFYEVEKLEIVWCVHGGSFRLGAGAPVWDD